MGGARRFFFVVVVVVVVRRSRRRRVAERTRFFFESRNRELKRSDPETSTATSISALQFVEEGTFQKQADMTRLRAKYGAAEARAILSREAAETEKAADANSTPLGREDDDQKKRAASFLPALPAAGAAEWLSLIHI